MLNLCSLSFISYFFDYYLVNFDLYVVDSDTFTVTAISFIVELPVVVNAEAIAIMEFIVAFRVTFITEVTIELVTY